MLSKVLHFIELSKKFLFSMVPAILVFFLISIILYVLGIFAAQTLTWALSGFYFYLMPANIFFLAIGIFFVRTPIYSLFCLIGVFIHAICLLLSLKVEFLALLLLIIYVGAIAILFLFVVMMFNLKEFISINSIQIKSPIVKSNKFLFLGILGVNFLKTYNTLLLKTSLASSQEPTPVSQQKNFAMSTLAKLSQLENQGDVIEGYFKNNATRFEQTPLLPQPNFEKTIAEAISEYELTRGFLIYLQFYAPRRGWETLPLQPIAGKIFSVEKLTAALHDQKKALHARGCVYPNEDDMGGTPLNYIEYTKALAELNKGKKPLEMAECPERYDAAQFATTFMQNYNPHTNENKHSLKKIIAYEYKDITVFSNLLYTNCSGLLIVTAFILFVAMLGALCLTNLAKIFKN